MSSSPDSDVITAFVCNEKDLKDGEMKVFELGDEGSILLVREKGHFEALGTKCTHYGAPLVKGVYYNGQIRCPWHGACFNSTTGDIEDFPGLDSIPKYETNVKDGQVQVTASKADLKKNARCKKMSKKIETNNQTFVIIGGGAAGQVCAETLRSNGFTGRLVMISKEKHLPYDRPKLSKSPGTKPEDLALRKQEFYDNADVELWLEKEVISVNTGYRVVKCSDGNNISYDSLMIATGGCPRNMQVPGSDSPDVFVLRTPDDANLIAEKAKSKKLVVVGSSFIGMEMAAYFVGKAESVTVIGRGDVPFKPVLGEVIGRRIRQLFEDRGVVFYMEAGVTELIHKNDKLHEVVLTNGRRLQADICVAGIGVFPVTDFLEGSEIIRNALNQVVVDEYMKTNVDNVYAGGDIVEFPLAVLDGIRVNIGHWQMAQMHGRIAALNMLKHQTPLHSVPYFWCTVFGKSIRYAGYGSGFDDVIIDGDLENLAFIAYYSRGNKVVAMASIGRDPMVSQFASLMKAGKVMTKDETRRESYPCVCC